MAKVVATTAALVGITAYGASRASPPPPEPGSGDAIAQDAYLASIHRDVWFDGTDANTLLRIGNAVCAGPGPRLPGSGHRGHGCRQPHPAEAGS